MTGPGLCERSVILTMFSARTMMMRHSEGDFDLQGYL